MAFLELLNKYFILPFNGIYEYNLVNTITYGLFAFLGIYFIKYFIKHKKIKLDIIFVRNLVPYIIFGALMRSYVDKGLIEKTFFTVSPGLYLTLASLFMIGLLFGKLKELGLLLLISFLLIYGISFSIKSYLIFILVLTIFASKLLLSWTKSLNFSKISNYALTAQLFDALNTGFILLFFGGFEKHVIPRAVIDFFGTPLAFIPAKLIIIIPVIYYLNGDKSKLSKLIIISIFVLGLAQGLRNLINVL
jgi:uncharacterized membrane protein